MNQATHQNASRATSSSAYWLLIGCLLPTFSLFLLKGVGLILGSQRFIHLDLSQLNAR